MQIAYVGSVIPRKALHVLLQALAQITALDWRLRVIGSLEADPAYSARVQHQAAQAPLAGRVQFLGSLAQAEVGSTLADCDVFALPSESEGYAIAYLEALGNGLPVIATAASGAVELVVHGENGFLVQPNDLEGIRAALELLTDGSRRQQMSQAARRTYDEHPTWKDAATAIRTFLLERIAAQEQAKANKRGFFGAPL